MSAQTLKCPEPGCEKRQEVWVPHALIHESEYNLIKACDEHRAKYEAIFREHQAACKRLGIPY